MAAFSYQHLLHHPFLFDSIFSPGTPTITNNSHFSQSHFPTETLAYQMAPVESAIVAESSSCIDQSSTKVATFSDNETSVTKKQSPESSAVVDKLESGEQVTQKVTKPMEKKRRTRNGPSPKSAQSKAKKHKKEDVAKTFEEEKELEIGSDSKEQVKAVKEVDPPTGYIHVRARRGQATDSHSLAERVRREKISERMKMLQRLVPGCDKVTGRAVMLDEIINYVQSLQNQVEFLSMKLASVNSPYYGFGTDIGDLMVKAELPEPFSTGPQCSPTQPPTVEFADTSTNNVTNTTTFTTACNNYPFLDSLLLQQAPRPNTFHQDSESIMWDMEDQRQSFLNPCGFNNNNLCSFN